MEAVMEWVMCGLGHVINFFAPAKNILIGVGAAALIVGGREWLQERRSRAGRAYYLAVRVSLVLDEYVEECARVVRDDGIEPERGNPVLIPLPDAPTFPDDVDWKSIDQKLMEDILTLPRRIEKTKNDILVPSDIEFRDEDHEEIVDEIHETYSIIGLDALKLTKQLRGKYKILEGDKNQKTDSRREKLFEDTIECIKRKRFLEDMEKEKEEYSRWNREEEEAQMDKDHNAKEKGEGEG